MKNLTPFSVQSLSVCFELLVGRTPNKENAKKLLNKGEGFKLISIKACDLTTTISFIQMFTKQFESALGIYDVSYAGKRLDLF